MAPTALLRSISAIVLVAFTSLTLQPLQAVAQAKLQQAKLAQAQAAPPSDEETYAKLLDAMKDTAQRGAAKAKQGQTSRDEAQTLKSQKAQLDALQAQIDQAFATTEADLKAKHLPQVILDRHQAAVADFHAKQAEFNLKLKALTSADDQDDEGARNQSITDLSTWLAQNQKGKPFTKTDPNKLPFRTPQGKVRPPIETPSGYKAQLGLFSKPIHLAGPIPAGLTLPQAIDPKAPPTAADLAPTEDVPLTPAIQAQVSTGTQISPVAGIEISPPGSRFGLFRTDEAGFQLLFESVRVAADVQRHGVMQ